MGSTWCGSAYLIQYHRGICRGSKEAVDAKLYLKHFALIDYENVNALTLLQELERNGASVNDLYSTLNPDFTITATSEYSANITFRDMLQH